MSEVLFVGREREKELYGKFLAKETPWVLIIVGLGGIGKTTLLRRLATYTEGGLREPHTHVVVLDFADEELRNDPLKIIDVLTKETASYCNLHQLDEQFKNELQQNIDHLTQLSAQRVQSGINEAEDFALREIRHQMRELATEAFYAQIKTCMLDHLIIMLDTCEWLNEPEGAEVGQWVVNELIPGIHARIRQNSHQCSVVMASRVLPKLDAINGREQRRITLPMLGEAEVDTYLAQKGMQDASLRQRVYEVTHGHALCVSIIGDFWQKRDEQTQSLTVADLPELQLEEFSEIALMRFTNERVLKQLKSPFKELTRYGVLLRNFDLPLLRNVFPDLLPESEALERFNQLIRYPYIESRGNYRYAFHELLREALAEEVQKEDAENWHCYHKRAFDYLNQVSPHSPDRYYHLLACDEQQGIMEWQQAIQEARGSGRREFVGTLLQAALDKTLRLSLSTCAEIQFEQGRFNYRNVQWEEALHNYQDALTSFQQINDLTRQAKVLQAIGDVQRTLAKHEAALASYEQVLSLFRQVKDLSGEARVLQAIGDVQQLRIEPEAALQSYEQALALFRQIGDSSEEAKILETLGDVQRTLGKHDAALRYYQQALALYQEEKDRPKRAKLLKTIGDVQWRHKDKYDALDSYGQALALYSELKEPVEEAKVRQAIENVQKPVSESDTPTENNNQIQEKAMTAVPTPQQSVIALQPIPVQPLPRRGSLSGLVLLPLALALLLIVGSSFIYYVNILHPAQLHALATAIVQTQSASTAIVQHNATATVQAVATATAKANPNTYSSNEGILVFNDPLSNNSQGQGWNVYSANGFDCAFTGGSYHAISIVKGFFTQCTAQSRYFTNFTFEIQMKIIKGDCGGIIFRDDITNGTFYLFEICQNGIYRLWLYKSNSGKDAITLVDHSSALINGGYNQSNIIAIGTNNDLINLFVNGQLIDTANDTSYSSGLIGVIAEANSSATEVAYTNAKVWV